MPNLVSLLVVGYFSQSYEYLVHSACIVAQELDDAATIPHIAALICAELKTPSLLLAYRRLCTPTPGLLNNMPHKFIKLLQATTQQILQKEFRSFSAVRITLLLKYSHQRLQANTLFPDLLPGQYVVYVTHHRLNRAASLKLLKQVFRFSEETSLKLLSHNQSGHGDMVSAEPFFNMALNLPTVNEPSDLDRRVEEDG